MAKQAALGDAYYLSGNDLSGDINSFSRISGGPAALDMTDITQLAYARQGGERDGGMDFASFFDPATAHPVLSGLAAADVISSYFRGRAVGNPAACCVGKQVNYDGNRAADGSFLLAVGVQASGFGLEWGVQLTPGSYTAANFLAGDASTFEGGIANWASALNSSVAQTAAQARSGTKSLAVTSTAGGTMAAAICASGNVTTQGLPVVPGQQVQCQAWVRTAVSARACRCQIDWYQANGTLISTDNSAATVNDSAAAWTLATATLTAPALAAFARLTVSVSSTGAGAEVHYVDDAAMYALPVSYDTGGSLSFGAQAWLHVLGFTGTDATIKVQDSADNVTFADVAGLGFTQVTAAPFAQRIAIANTATVRRYVNATVVTTAGFTALSYAVVLRKNEVAGVVF